MTEEVFLARPTPAPVRTVRKTGKAQPAESDSLQSFEKALSEQEKKQQPDNLSNPVIPPLQAPVIAVEQEQANPATSGENPLVLSEGSMRISGPGNLGEDALSNALEGAGMARDALAGQRRGPGGKAAALKVGFDERFQQALAVPDAAAPAGPPANPPSSQTGLPQAPSLPAAVQPPAGVAADPGVRAFPQPAQTIPFEASSIHPTSGVSLESLGDGRAVMPQALAGEADETAQQAPQSQAASPTQAPTLPTTDAVPQPKGSGTAARPKGGPGQAGEENLTRRDVPGLAPKKPTLPILYSPDQGKLPSELQAVVQQASEPMDAAGQPVVQQLIGRIQEAVQRGRTSLHIQLHPNDLGAIDVRLVSNGQSVSISIVAERPGTNQLLEKQMDQLRSNLSGVGIQLADVNIGHQAAHGQPGGSFAREPAAERFMEGGGNPANSQAETGSGPLTNRASTDSRIDYRI